MRIRTRQAQISIHDSGGDGFPLLLLHGAGAAKDVFVQQFESAIAQQFRVIALDLPGHGDSSDAHDPTQGYTVGGYAGAVSEAMAALGVRRAAVYGWSLGGHIAIELLGSTDLVAGLMLTGAPPVGRGPIAMLRGFHTSWDMLLASKDHFNERDVDRFAALCFEDAAEPAFRAAIERADGRSRPVFQRSMMRGDGVDQRLTVEATTVPIGIVNGQREPFARLGYFPTLSYRSLWRDTCFVISGAGHAPLGETLSKRRETGLGCAENAEQWQVGMAGNGVIDSDAGIGGSGDDIATRIAGGEDQERRDEEDGAGNGYCVD
ncbi:MAG: alpha/beta hydrolase, partial [Hyphomicrobiales bacterium]